MSHWSISLVTLQLRFTWIRTDAFAAIEAFWFRGLSELHVYAAVDDVSIDVGP